MCVEVTVEVFGVFVWIDGSEGVAFPALKHVAVEAGVHDAGRHVEGLAIGSAAFADLVHVLQIAEVVGNDGIHHFLSSRVVAVARLYANVVEEDDASGTCLMRRVGQIVDEGGIGVGSVIAIAVARGYVFIDDEGDVEALSLRVGRAEVIDPNDVGGRGGSVFRAEVEQLLYGGHFAVEVAAAV